MTGKEPRPIVCLLAILSATKDEHTAASLTSD